MPRLTYRLEAVPVTKGPKHHFFGYYDKLLWDEDDRYILANEVDFMDRPPSGHDKVTIGIIDTQNNFSFEPISESSAWCWQQGNMLQWVPNARNLIIHNDRIGDRFVSKMIDVKTRHTRVLPRPIYTLSNDGQKALSLNFSRLAVTRPGYGYNGLLDWRHDELHPADDGIYIMDLETGDHRLIVSLDELAHIDPEESMRGVKHWFNHLLFNPTGKRFIFLHRWHAEDGRSFITRLCTANADGSDLFVSSLKRASHFIWYDDSHILVWGVGPEGPGYYIIEDRTDKMEIMGKDVLTRDGHCTVSPDQEWILTDEYPDRDNYRTLILYKPSDNLRVDIGYFYSPPELAGEIRCDLHPKWSRSGMYVCIDSAHEGTRQMYILDVTPVIENM